MGSAYVARASRARAHVVKRGLHRLDNGGVLAHAQIVVGAPDGDRLGAIASKALGVGIIPLRPQDVDKDPVTALVVEALDGRFKDAIVIHRSKLIRQPCLPGISPGCPPSSGALNVPLSRIPLRTTRKKSEVFNLGQAISGKEAEHSRRSGNKATPVATRPGNVHASIRRCGGDAGTSMR
jgi:hypothetical protein